MAHVESMRTTQSAAGQSWDRSSAAGETNRARLGGRSLRAVSAALLALSMLASWPAASLSRAAALLATASSSTATAVVAPRACRKTRSTVFGAACATDAQAQRTSVGIATAGA